MKVINLWGAPSSGKSTTAAGLFFLMKINKKRVELVTEFAKDLVWEGREQAFGDQTFIYGEQNHRLHRLEGKVDFTITDSPIPLPIFYMPKGYLKKFPEMVMEQFHRYENINYLLKRNHAYENNGRRHSEEQSQEIADELEQFLNEQKINYTVIEANPYTPTKLFEEIEKEHPSPVGMTLEPIHTTTK